MKLTGEKFILNVSAIQFYFGAPFDLMNQENEVKVGEDSLMMGQILVPVSSIDELFPLLKKI